jgi:hypothetical protein
MKKQELLYCNCHLGSDGITIVAKNVVDYLGKSRKVDCQDDGVRIACRIIHKIGKPDICVLTSKRDALAFARSAVMHASVQGAVLYHEKDGVATAVRSDVFENER